LPFCQVKVSGKFPTLLFWDVGIEKKLFLQFEGLKLWIGFPLLSDADVACPVVQGIAKTGRRKKETWKRKWNIQQHVLKSGRGMWGGMCYNKGHVDTTRSGFWVMYLIWLTSLYSLEYELIQIKNTWSSNKRGEAVFPKWKVDRLVLAPKWGHLWMEWIWVLWTQLLDPTCKAKWLKYLTWYGNKA